MARDLWERLLQDRSVAHRRYAGELIATHGGAEDVPAAITALGQAWRSTHTPRQVHDASGPVVAPARGSELLNSLWRHREQPAAAAEHLPELLPPMA